MISEAIFLDSEIAANALSDTGNSALAFRGYKYIFGTYVKNGVLDHGALLLITTNKNGN